MVGRSTSNRGRSFVTGTAPFQKVIGPGLTGVATNPVWETLWIEQMGQDGTEGPNVDPQRRKLELTVCY